LLFGAAVRLLLDNLDIALWATCLVQSWTPELGRFQLVDCLSVVLTPGTGGFLPLTVTYVDVPVSGNPNATMWAFVYGANSAADGSVGLIIPIGSATWQGQVGSYIGGGDDATCAAIQVAGTILHELIHVCADEVVNPYYVSPFPWTNLDGALHEASSVTSPCWDEPRMVATMFYWAMARRYACIGQTSGCGKFLENWRFAHSMRGV
jgi:hypothetical protein